MPRLDRKPLLTPREELINKPQRRVVEQRPPKPSVGTRYRDSLSRSRALIKKSWFEVSGSLF